MSSCRLPHIATLPSVLRAAKKYGFTNISAIRMPWYATINLAILFGSFVANSTLATTGDEDHDDMYVSVRSAGRGKRAIVQFFCSGLVDVLLALIYDY